MPAHRLSRSSKLTFPAGAWYRELQSDFGIRRNTLAPVPGRYLAPWIVAPGSCCYNNTPGVPQFNVSAALTGQWNETYFTRLGDFLTTADELGVHVNLGLCSVLYDDGIWSMSPFYSVNNVNGIGANQTGRNDFFHCSSPTDISSCAHPEIVQLMAAFVVKLVSSVGSIGNWFLELINEPYATSDSLGPRVGSPFLNWQAIMAQTAQQAMAATGNIHLLSQNYHDLNRRWFPSGRVPAVSVVTWHYMTTANLEMNRPQDIAPAGPTGSGVIVGTSETGFEGNGDEAYRTKAWSTMLSGSATYNNLDYSFSTAFPNGTDLPIPASTPGGGGPFLRTALGTLQTLLSSLPLDSMQPSSGLVAGLGDWPPVWYRGCSYSILATDLTNATVPATIAGYMFSTSGWNGGAPNGTAILALAIPPLQDVSQTWTGYWIDPSGITPRAGPWQVQVDDNGALELTTPQFGVDVAFLLQRNAQ